jgi:hypothetical protein
MRCAARPEWIQKLIPREKITMFVMQFLQPGIALGTNPLGVMSA